jgi:hypothetical protein
VACFEVMRTEWSRLRTDCDCASVGLDPLAYTYSCIQGWPGPRHVDAPGSLIIWRSLKSALLKLFRPKIGLANFFFGGGA